ncbi:P-loop containing nucleoside triphosphate hydrolase protein [Sordaria brevicollis]|uniref:P-loop containing nucleoside triphosphate hydrolase protein n=1 Tax=Sordaria brevicollis TaxID=83679 RepID=A0AAE0P2C8_SORBR|nr:P-loop containing nucleoside triphosphate hydrolase protein [Sordaria brevicollis]
MDDQVMNLHDKIVHKFKELPADQRLLVGMAGIPGSGKTTLAKVLAHSVNHDQRINNSSQKDIAIALPMDGFHLTRAQLSAMPDPVLAHARRGAEFTFDGQGFYELVKELRKPIGAECTTIWAPSFDHAVKDPVEKGIEVSKEKRVVIFEGNYLLLKQKPWSDAAKLMDLTVFVRVPFDVAKARLVPRHVAAGIAATEAEAIKRVEENDLVNGKMIEDMSNRDEVDVVVESTEDAEWVHA